MTTQKQIRESFWQSFPEYAHERRTRKRQNEYSATVRTAFVNHVDLLHRDGQISDRLAYKVTL